MLEMISGCLQLAKYFIVLLSLGFFSSVPFLLHFIEKLVNKSEFVRLEICWPKRGIFHEFRDGDRLQDMSVDPEWHARKLCREIFNFQGKSGMPINEFAIYLVCLYRELYSAH